jgi:bifunctional DNase/RNase
MLQVHIGKLLAAAGCFLTAFLWSTDAFTASGIAPVANERNDLLQITVHRIIMEPTSNDPVVLLADSQKQRALFIGIGFNEARAIYSEMKGIKFRRPLTHDLLEEIIRRTSGKIRHIVITQLKEKTYYAMIEMEIGKSIAQIDARPSDSLVLALKFKAPIYVSKSLFKEMALPLGGQAEIGEQYGLILQDLTPSLAQYFSYDSTEGVFVSEVRKGSRAEKDGIKIGDIFVEIEDQKIEDMFSMKEALKSGISLKARIFRESQFSTITLDLE